MTSLDLMTLRKIGNTIALKKAAEKNEKRKFLAKPKTFGTKYSSCSN